MGVYILLTTLFSRITCVANNISDMSATNHLFLKSLGHLTLFSKHKNYSSIVYNWYFLLLLFSFVAIYLLCYFLLLLFFIVAIFYCLCFFYECPSSARKQTWSVLLVILSQTFLFLINSNIMDRQTLTLILDFNNIATDGIFSCNRVLLYRFLF